MNEHSARPRTSNGRDSSRALPRLPLDEDPVVERRTIELVVPQVVPERSIRGIIQRYAHSGQAGRPIPLILPPFVVVAQIDHRPNAVSDERRPPL